MNKKKIVSGAGLALLLLGIAAAALIVVPDQRLRGLMPESVREEVDFPILIAAEWDDAPLKKDSVRYSSGALFFDYGDANDTVTITEQKRADTFNLDEFADSKGLTAAQKIDTKWGKALSGTSGNRKIIILDTDRTLVIVLSSATKPSNDKQIDRLRKVDP